MICRKSPRFRAVAPVDRPSSSGAPSLLAWALAAAAALSAAGCSDSASTDGTTTTLPSDTSSGFDVPKSDGDAGKADTSVSDVSGKACVVQTDCDDDNPCTDDLCISKKCQIVDNAAK